MPTQEGLVHPQRVSIESLFVEKLTENGYAILPTCISPNLDIRIKKQEFIKKFLDLFPDYPIHIPEL
jgi:hypothetical protein